MRIVLATCERLPEPDPDELPLLDALRARRVEVCSLAWDDERVQDDFAAADLTLLRATWNYPEQPERFGAWVDAVSGRTRLWNPAEVVRWNMHKGYLLALGARGVEHVPTELVACGDAAPLREIRARRGFDAVVIKPAIGAGSLNTRRFAAGDPDGEAEAEAHLAALVAHGDALVQPYLAAVETRGERSLIWIDGELTHAMRKAPRFSGDAEHVERVHDVTAEERALALSAVAAVQRPLLYARVDMVTGDDGKPLLMELELIEPSLYFVQSAHALERFADAALQRARQRTSALQG